MDAAADEACPTAPSARYASGVVLAIGGTFLFALKSIFIKLAYAAGAEPTVLLTLRMGIALPLYVVVLWHSWRTLPNTSSTWRRDVPLAVVLGFLGYYLASYLDLCGLTHISAQLERLTLFTYPTMIAVLAALFLDERLTPRIVLAIALSYAGVWLMYGQEKLISASQSAGEVKLGVLLVLGSALSYSLYVLFAKPIMQRIGSRQFTSLAMIGSTGFVAAHFLATRSPAVFADLRPVVYLYGVVLAFVCTVLPSFTINESILRIGATRTTVIGTAGPVLTVLLAVAILHEPTSVYHALGMLLAIAGVSLVAVK